MIKIVPLICPNCGAELEVRSDTKTCFCTYCGTKLFIDNNSETVTFNKNINITHRSIDETKIEKMRIQQQMYKDAMEYNKNVLGPSLTRGLLYILLIVVVSVLLLGICCWFAYQ